VADRCLFFEDLLRLTARGHRRFELVERPAAGLTCIEARVRSGPDWCFARRWIRTASNARELYHAIDRLEALGFRFDVRTQDAHALRSGDVVPEPELARLRASRLLAGLTEEERRVHAELFPDEHKLLRQGYDWDAHHVYRGGVSLAPDVFGRILDVDADILYEWVRVEDEATWRRYPLERVRALTARGR